ncbi:30S ribosomal protein S7 [Patescibacteria group bacterium]
MRRKRKIKKIINQDFKYNSTVIAKFINYLMKEGKKSTARKILYDSFDIISKSGKDVDALEIFDLAIKNVSPLLEVKSRRIGGAHYQVPCEVRGERKFALASRWIIGAARNKKGKPMAEKLAMELIEASNNEGTAIKKKQDTRRMADANKAFAHFAR